jgi:hypothetical protein
MSFLEKWNDQKRVNATRKLMDDALALLGGPEKQEPNPLGNTPRLKPAREKETYAAPEPQSGMAGEIVNGYFCPTPRKGKIGDSHTDGLSSSASDMERRQKSSF